jgi:hypothetical protein
MKVLLTVAFLIVLLFASVQGGLMKNKNQNLVSEKQNRASGSRCRYNTSCASGVCSNGKCTWIIFKLIGLN